ncbi:ATP-binding protein [Geobacter sp.]|uniref:PAS domain-containing sensor histidine kinase n=1 Tax=Geobacter sp. TaxID=46610 RepID=UPI00260638EB|nr:ATP-binding protein [Geobacter sp.]
MITFSRPLTGIGGKPVATVVVRMDAPDIRQLVREMDNNAFIGTALMAVLAILVVFVLVSRQRLKNANANLDTAQQTAQMGSWQRELESGDTSWSENLYRIFGLAPKETVPGPETFYTLVHPDDLPRVREAIERSAREKSGYEIEFRLIRPDGAVRVMRSRGEAYPVAVGRTRLVGSTQDITERSLMEQRLSSLIRQKDAFDHEADILARKGLSFENGVPPGLVVRGVPAQIEELFVNLVSNAVSYSPEGSVIRISAAEDNRVVAVAVRDDGIGLEPEQLDQIFDEFYRGDEARHELGRPGLGLAICRRIIANHQGSIWAESAGKGKGTTIRFTLPHLPTGPNTISDKEPAHV